MKRRAKTIPQHNYLRKLQLLWRTGAIPRTVGLHQIDVAHDNWCTIFEGRRCNCNPDVTLKWSQPTAAQN
jgi:hypothetical protein